MDGVKGIYFIHDLSKRPPNIAAGRNQSGTSAALAEDTLDHLLRFLKESDGSPGRTDAAIAASETMGLSIYLPFRCASDASIHSTPLECRKKSIYPTSFAEK